jgi:predicted phosphodiesterase
MKVAALSDIHGMVDALEAVLAEVEREDVDAVLLGGDVVGGPQPAEVLARLRGVEQDLVWIRGNGEAEPEAPGEAREVVQWTIDRLEPEDCDFLVGTPARAELEIEGLGRTLFCHATPDSDLVLVTEETSDADLPTPFDVEAAIEAVLASGWPDAESFVEENLRAAVTRGDAIEFFERRAVELGQRG